MDFQWSENKAEANIVNHKIDFVDAVGVFEDLNALTIDDPHPYEQRFLTIGLDFLSRVLVVSYTWRNDSIRIISARKATKKERRQYEVEL